MVTCPLKDFMDGKAGQETKQDISVVDGCIKTRGELLFVYALLAP